jgi:hypothetical protein
MRSNSIVTEELIRLEEPIKGVRSVEKEKTKLGWFKVVVAERVGLAGGVW